MTVILDHVYPAHLECDVVLRNGRTLRLRPIRSEDRDALKRFYALLSPQSMHNRFFHLRTPEAAVAATPADIDYRRDFALIGEIGTEIVAVAHYLSLPKHESVAEVAFAIRDDHQGLGIGTRLLERLADVARTNGITKFEAETLGENYQMLDVFLGSGFQVVSKSAEGVVRVLFPIEPTPEFAAAAAARSQKAAHASMRPIFEPRSIAVVGASRRPGQLGHEIVDNLVENGYRGKLYVVHPTIDSLDSVKAYSSLEAIPDMVDLAIVAVPAREVEHVIDDCIAKGVPAAVVISAGFGETGSEGRAMEQRLLEKLRASGMRMVGPNCMGVINADPAVSMQATFAPVFPPAGTIAMSSQSGALGLAILDYARSLNIGFSTFVSVGNKADVSGNDLIQYWAEDPKTEVILLYLESFGNPQKFAEITRRVGKKKPIVVVKAGRSASGAKAASSHTGALATNDATVTAMLRQAGVIRTDTLEELFDIASLLAHQPLPRGRNIAIVTNAGGPGILAADACEANGLTLATLSADTAAHLRQFLPPAASVGNPVDMIASATPDQYAKTLQAVLADPAVDAVIAIYIPVLATDAPQVATSIRDAAKSANGKTLIATFMSVQGLPEPLSPVPSFPFPERAANALARAVKYAEWRRRPTGTIQKFADIDEVAVRAIIDRKVEEGGGWLDAGAVRDLLRAAKIDVVETETAGSADAAVEVAKRIGFPVVLKAEGLLHKSDTGGVKLSLADEAAVRGAFAELKTSSVIVQKMIKGGVEMMVGATADPSFGHLIAYGAGGTLVELIADVSLRIHPLTAGDIEDMFHEVRASRLLRGFRGIPASDTAKVKETLGRLSALLTIAPEIREIDVNPLTSLPDRAVALDARVRVEAIELAPPSRRVTY
jgi:acetyl coenzyme A synthetase (ADP forming)-like protein